VKGRSGLAGDLASERSNFKKDRQRRGNEGLSGAIPLSPREKRRKEAHKPSR